MTLKQNEKRKQWLTRGPLQRAIDHAKLRAKIFSKAQNLDKDTILVSKIKVDEIYDYSFASIIDFPLADILLYFVIIIDMLKQTPLEVHLVHIPIIKFLFHVTY